MATKTEYTIAELFPLLVSRLGGLMALEIKEERLFPVKPKVRKEYSSKYKRWNDGVKAAPTVVFKGYQIITDGYETPSDKKLAGTPDEYEVNENGLVVFDEAQTAADIIQANFTFRLFSEDELRSALEPMATSKLATCLPICIDTDHIPFWAIEPLIGYAMLELFMAMDSEQHLYYSYTIQEQSHQLAQVHDNLRVTITGLQTELKDMCDSIMWFRLQGKSRRTTSIKLSYIGSDVLVGYGSRHGGIASLTSPQAAK